MPESGWRREDDQRHLDRLEYVLEATTDGIYDWDITTGEVFFSPAYFRMLGYEPGAFPSTFEAWRNHVHPEDLVAAEGAIARHFEPPYEPYAVQFRMRTASGEWRWILSRGKVVQRDPEGRPLRMVGTHIDIHARKVAEERYRHLFENLTSGFALHEVILEDGKVVDYRWLEVNPAFERMTGLKAEVVLGRTVKEVLPQLEPYWIENYGKVVLLGEPLSFDNYSADLGRWYETYAFRTGPLQFAVLVGDITARKAVELARQRSEADFRLLAENSSDLITRHDLAGRYLWVSPSAKELIGCDPERLVGQDAFENIHPEDRDRLRGFLELILTQDRAEKVQYRHRGKQDTWIWVESVARSIRNDRGEPLELHVSTRNIDESHREARLMEETHALAHVGGWEIDVVQQKVRWTKEALRILGFDPNGPMPTLAQVREGYSEASKARIMAASSEGMRNGTSWDLELDRLDPSGNKVVVRINGKAELHEGKVIRLFGAVHDITEAKASRQRELELEQFHRNLLETSGGLIVVFDRQGRITRFNSACERLTGWKEAEVLGRQVFEFLVPEEQRAGVEALFQNLRPAEFPNWHENDWLTRSGKRCWIAWANSAILDEQGDVRYVVGTGLDRTEKQQAEEALRQMACDLEHRVQERTEELREANREMEAFTYSISHDLRAPLRAVDGFSHMLREDFGSSLNENGLRYLDEIRKGAQRMGDLIDDLLRISRIGRTELNLVPVDMNGLLQEAMSELRFTGQFGEVELQVEPLPSCRADAALLKQVWINLLSNAFKFSRGQGLVRIEIGGRVESEARIYWVRDHGVGFDMRYAHKLFHVFHRLHKQEDFEGTGIGLALCRHILGRHGGQIWAEARPMEGASFSFSIPDRGGLP